jgi:hypothetical protein
LPANALPSFANATRALAKFRNGLFDDAIALQRRGLEPGKGTRHGCKQRLREYVEAKKAGKKPRKKER